MTVLNEAHFSILKTRTASNHASEAQQQDNHMSSDPGSYVLILNLAKTKAIRIGQLGTFTFPAGWFGYCGSAHGAGGVKARVDRHCKRRKTRKWHIDYLCEHAEITEIWYSHSPRISEHVLAQIMARMPGADIPAHGFGSSDCDNCPAHLIRLPSRPLSAVLHASLSEIVQCSASLFVEFVEPALRTAEHAKTVGQPLLGSYFRGRRFLEEHRTKMLHDGINTRSGSALLRFACGTPGRLLVERLAAEMGITVAMLMDDAKFADAVDTIIGSCGASAFDVLFSPARPQTRKAIMMLSRTTDTRQHYRVTGVAEGNFRSVGPQNDDPVYDTVSYSEIPSRLARARGSLLKLFGMLAQDADERISTECGKINRLTVDAVRRLRKFVTSRNPIDERLPQHLSRDEVFRILYSRSVRGKEIGMARQTLHFVGKNLWDYHQASQRGLRPSPEELRRTLNELNLIELTAKRILHFPDRFGTACVKIVATHAEPDADALVAAWIAERFLFNGYNTRVVFVSKTLTPKSPAEFDCVVDVGNMHSPELRIFDHKPPAFPDRHASCAAKLLFEHLLESGHRVQHLQPLVQLVHDGDSIKRRAGSIAYRQSRKNGLHAEIARLKTQGLSDDQLYRRTKAWLDRRHGGRSDPVDSVTGEPLGTTLSHVT